MSTEASEVVEAIAETETQEAPQLPEESFDIQAGVDSIATDLFGTKPAEEAEEIEEVEETEQVETGEQDADEEAQEPPEEKETRPAPQSWKKEMHDAWGKLDSDTQEYIELRENQMREGVEIKKEDANLGMKLRDAFSPYENILRQNNVDPVTASQKLMSTHMQLLNAPLETRKQLFSQLAASYGITDDSGEPADPKIQQLEQRLSQVQNVLRASQQASQQEQATRIQSEVEEFASKNPHFDDLSDEIAKLIRADYSLEDAYKVAYKASHYYDMDIEKKQKEEAEKAEKAKKEEAEKAKKAKSVNVRGRNTTKAPTAPKGTMEDTMREVMREINSRN